MAYSSFRGPQSPRDDNPFPTYASNPLSPQRNPHRLSGGFMPTAADSRAGLQRRFTTNALPTLSPIGQQRLQAAGEVKQPNRYSAVPPSEQKSRFYESLLAEQRRIQAYIEQIDPETRREVDQNLRHEHAVSQMIAQSEPTTPPEYGDAFPSAFSKPNRYSATSMTSASGMSTRQNRLSAHLTSPPSGFSRLYNANSNLPSQSVPTSRRQSGDGRAEDDFLPTHEATIHRNTTNPNRNSLPVTSHDRKRTQVPDLSTVLGPVNTTSFLFGDEDPPSSLTAKGIRTSPSDGKTYLQVQHTADGFPKLIRREENGTAFLIEPTPALDLALSKNERQQLPDRSTGTRHRISLPPASSRNQDPNLTGIGGVPINPNDRPTANNARPALKATPSRGVTNGDMQPASYSTNDVPSLKSVNGAAVTSPPARASDVATTPSSAQQTAAALARVPSGPNHVLRPSQDFTSQAKTAGAEMASFDTPSSALQASAPPFGPIGNSAQQENGLHFANMSPYAQPGAYGGYGMQMLTNGFGNMNFGAGFSAQGQWASGPAYQQQTSFNNGYQQFPPNGQAVAGASRFNSNDVQRPNTQQRRAQQEETLAKISSISVEQLKGDIYSLCIDQHGCRFLQRKLDDHDAQTTQLIFDEVHPHIVKLMVDPFGNYLCQKLLENCNNEQRTELIKNAMKNMTEIALNQHGTRALQKMIEFINTPDQTDLIIEALRFNVVTLIQDLNGNHVIQKCLNHLKPRDAQFIFDAVGSNCVTVGTHRHGCCVLQRCIDHAAGLQKGELVRQITLHAMTLVQDPFGNYVVQYILDIGEPCFTEPVCKAFLGNIPHLSKQKFSSNVIEKCIRCAGEETRGMVIREIALPSALESLLRDSYANYVVQTAMDFADDDTKATLVDNLRPLLTSVRHTPYGRRIQSKINDYDGHVSSVSSGTMTPAESYTGGSSAASPQGALSPYGAYAPTASRTNRMGFVGAPPAWPVNGHQGHAAGHGYSNSIDSTSPAQQRGGGYGHMPNGGGAHNFQPSNGGGAHSFQPSNGGGAHGFQSSNGGGYGGGHGGPGFHGPRQGQNNYKFF